MLDLARLASMIPATGGSLEHLLTAPHLFGLETATPLQRIVCRVIDGEPLGELVDAPLLPAGSDYDPEIVERATLRWCIGDPADLPEVPPQEVYLVAGIRTFKSLLVACIAFRATQVCQVDHLRPGEDPRVSVLSLRTDLAKVVQDHLVGAIESKPALRSRLGSDPTMGSVRLVHPSGRPIEVRTVAGARAGGSVVARWSAGAIFDEFPRMVGSESDKVINFDDARDAVSGRLLPGAQLLGVGSPWAPFGPAWRRFKEHHGKPSPDIVFIRAPAPALNPYTWTPEACRALKRRNPNAYRTDVLCEFADAETSMFSTHSLELCVRPRVLETAPVDGQFYVAAIDPATRSDAFALVVVTAIPCEKWGHKLSVALVRAWEPPLSPDEVLGEIATILRPYRTNVVYSDQWSADALRDLGSHHGLVLHQEPINRLNKVDMFDSLAALVADQRVELPPHDGLLDDLRRVRRKVTQDSVSIHFPRADGRHCDYAMAAAMALSRTVPAPELASLLTDHERRKTELGLRMARRRGGDEDWL